MQASFSEIIRQGIRKKYGSLLNFCKVHRIHYPTLYGVLTGHKTSRPIIFQIAKDLNMPELCFLYEQFLHELKSGGAKGGSQSKEAKNLDKTKEG